MQNLYIGNCLDVLKTLNENSIDSIVTDPPYGLSFMAKKWDYDVPSTEIWQECLRVLKPGGHLIAFFGTRTYHRGVVRIEDAGFEIRDQIMWIYGSGFPKSHNIKEGDFKGWGTALKPANEPIVVARKPLEKGLTIAENVVKCGTGAINIDDCRIETSDKIPQTSNQNIKNNAYKSDNSERERDTVYNQHTQGRWPANIIFDEEAAQMLDEQSGLIRSRNGYGVKGQTGGGTGSSYKMTKCDASVSQKVIRDDENGVLAGASRFFYVAKASKSERNKGLDSYEQIDIDNECKEENTVAVQLLQKVILESMVKWSTGECGKKLTALFPKECKSIILTEINKIIELKILNALMRSLTNESIQDVLTDLNHVENVESLKKFLLIITKEKMELALGAVNAASKMLQSIKENENSKDFNNFHSTVKPIKLMQYLIKLVTPPNGTVLDPFMGSGSTGVAAKQLGFNFTGIELSEEYFEIAKKRIENNN